VKLTEETGYMWFFSQQNVEIVIKVLDGCAINGHYWVFAAGLTNQGVDITVTDTLRSAPPKHYINPLNTTFVTKTDVEALQRARSWGQLDPTPNPSLQRTTTGRSPGCCR
jgi:hypothetical protein